MNHSVVAIAAIAHEANRAWCEFMGDTSQLPWDDAPEWQRESAINGVMFHAQNPTAGDDASHNNWSAEKIAAGWIYGEVKDPEALPPTHPCLVPFEELPAQQQFKDKLFRTIVRAALDFNNGQGGLALDELTRLGQHLVGTVGYVPEPNTSIVDSAINVVDSLRYGNPKYRADLGITREEIARRGMAEDAEGTALDVIDKLGWPNIDHPQGKPATHVLVPLAEVAGGLVSLIGGQKPVDAVSTDAPSPTTHEERRTYVGVKVVTAWRECEAEAFPNKSLMPTCADPLAQRGRAGYAVIYDDGYRSWSPADVFEAAYHPVPADEAAERARRAKAAITGIVEGDPVNEEASGGHRIVDAPRPEGS